MDKLKASAITLLIIFAAAAGTALALGTMHVPVSYMDRWAACTLIITSARLAALTMGDRR